MMQLISTDSRWYESLEQAYHKYEEYMDGYSIFSTQVLYIPFYKVRFKVSYTATTDMNIFEEYICRMVAMNIDHQDDIQEALSADEQFLHMAIQELTEDSILSVTDDKICAFTEKGRTLFEMRRKHETREDYFTWYYDGLSDGFFMDYFESEEQHEFIDKQNIASEEGAILLPPKVVPEYLEERDRERMESFLIGKIRDEHREMAERLPMHINEIASVENFKMLEDNKLLFHKYYCFMYIDENQNYRLLVHDPCGNIGIDARVTQLLEKMLDNDSLNYEFMEIIKDLPTMDMVLQSLRESILSEELMLSIEEREEHEAVLTKIENKRLTCKIFGTKQIQKTFDDVVKTAEQNLYIISPWMNKRVIDENFRDSIENLLKKGVKVHIMYGFDGNKTGDYERTERTENRVAFLRKMGEKYGDLLSITKGKTHEKVLIWDNSNLMIGSFNFLSYNANQFDDVRNETCLYVEDSELVQEMIDLRFR